MSEPLSATLSSATSTEAAAVAEIAAKPSLHHPVEMHSIVTLPPGWRFEDFDAEKWRVAPQRSRGTVVVHTAGAFVEAVSRRRYDRTDTASLEQGVTALYGDEERMALTAVLNDDVYQQAGWRDYRVNLALRRRPEWLLWKSMSQKLLTQEEFANHIEAGLDELVTPSPADMLDIAQTFHATTAARFKSGHRLSSGEVKFLYDEEIDAKAGKAGELSVPDRFELAIRPFFGSERYKVFARLRYLLKGGAFQLGYTLERPDDIERAAFTAVAVDVATRLDTPLIAGVAPEPTA